MGTTFSRAAGAADQPDDKTLEERTVIGNLIRTDIEAEQLGTDEAVPLQMHATAVVEESSEVPSPTTPDRRAGMDKADAQDPAAVLSEAAEKAYMCYQRSEAEAAAHQSTARPGTEQAATAPQEEAGQQGQGVNEAAAPAQGNSYRSRKRQLKQAASQVASQESTPGKRRRQEYERLLEYTHTISNNDVHQPGGSSGRRRKSTQVAGTPAKSASTPRRRSTSWQYVGPDMTGADIPHDEWVTCPDGRSYPSSMTYSKGDLLLDEYLDKTDDDQLYVVEAIIDERRRGKKREFRIKWEGFEMNPEEWIPYGNIKDVAELDAWEAKLGKVQ